MTALAQTIRPSTRLLAILFSAVLLCACGQTGALYLPEEAPEETTEDAPGQEAKPKRDTGDNH